MYVFGIRIASLFSPKAKLWIEGRKGWKGKIEKETRGVKNIIWFHCASLGEFEQARPLIESIGELHPQFPILLSFFSPSGYEIRKQYSGAKWVVYLPPDLPENANYFLDTIDIKAAFFIRYDIWVNFILGLKKREVPHFLISARVDEHSRFLSSLNAKLYRKAFQSFDWIFCQDEKSENLLKNFTRQTNVTTNGDTRLDRVMKIKTDNIELTEIVEFIAGRFCVIGGSVYDTEIEWLLKLSREWSKESVCFILAPHEIQQSKIQYSIDADSEKQLLFSKIKSRNIRNSILWIDNIGMLNNLYRYGHVAMVGGGFGKGIHNIQEPGIWAIPILFGPKHHKFGEAKALIELGAGFEISDYQHFKEVMTMLKDNSEKRLGLGRKAAQYFEAQSGATHSILQRLESLGLWNDPVISAK